MISEKLVWFSVQYHNLFISCKKKLLIEKNAMISEKLVWFSVQYHNLFISCKIYKMFDRLSCIESYNWILFINTPIITVSDWRYTGADDVKTCQLSVQAVGGKWTRLLKTIIHLYTKNKGFFCMEGNVILSDIYNSLL
jgi:hypothetical protein